MHPIRQTRTNRLRLLFLIVAIFAYSNTGYSATDELPLIHVSAQGKVSAKPNQATLSMRFMDTQLKADDARRKVDQQVRHLLDQLSAYKLKKASLDSSQTQIHPQYDYRNDQRQLKGYQVIRSVNFILLDLSQLDNLLKTITKSQAAQLNNIQFGLSNKAELEQQALNQAIENSKLLAQQIAAGYAVELGQIHSANFQAKTSRPPMRAMAMSMEMAKSDAEEPSYHQKDIDFTAHINVAFTFE